MRNVALLRRTTMFDLDPATTRMCDVLSSITGEQLQLPTPCPDLRVGDLVDHVGMSTPPHRRGTGSWG